ncbi:hypothetical protein [Afifella sp. IM 167]|uniref:hypothetical protein n=1 Tax=Afifella sp. IM 167 TaxID=2033586 RepID=UPI001CCA2DD6|nr:hypothetical protein [Afifella sp. IM 167]
MTQPSPSTENPYLKLASTIGGAALSFSESGIFFILLGAVVLWIAFTTHADPATHSAFTFVFVVLGVALVLYGTGTQSTGRFEAPPGQRFVVQASLAGGAGVIALLLGYGMLEKYPEIRAAFASQSNYVVVPIRPRDELGNEIILDDFAIEVRFHDENVPVYRQGRSFLALMPVPSTALDQSRSIKFDVELYYIKSTPNPQIEAHVEGSDEITLSDINNYFLERGFGFRRLEEERTISLPIYRTHGSVPAIRNADNPPTEGIGVNRNIARSLEQIRNNLSTEHTISNDLF